MRYGSRTAKVTAVFTVVALLLSFGPMPTADAGDQLTVPAGTLVMVRPADVFTPKTHNSGDTVNFIVVQDVKIKDRVLIKAGATARGQITESKKAGIVGMPAKIGVELQTVEAIDGSLIPIRASKSMEGEDKIVLTVVLTLICLPLILIKGGDTQISSGTTFDAFTLGTAEVTPE